MKVKNGKKDKKLFLYITAGRLLLFILLFIGALIVPDIYSSPLNIRFISLLLGSAFLLTLIWIIWFKKFGLTDRLKNYQIVADVLLASVAIWLTGGIESIFTFLYSIAIITACLLSPEQMGGRSALLSILFYALICLLTYKDNDPLQRVFFLFFLNMGAFGLIALLSINLAKKLKKAEEKLIETNQDIRLLEEIQRHLANSMKSGLITLDLKGNILFYNVAALEILGDLIKDSYGKKLKEILPEFEKVLSNCSANSQESPRSELKIKVNEREIILGTSCFQIYDQFKGEVLGRGIIFQDITEIKAQEEKLKLVDRLAALGEMAAGFAHEIRNPLASISGAAEFIEQSDLVLPEGKRLLQIIQKEVNRLANLTSSFLLYGRPERKDIKKVDLYQELSSILHILKQRKDLKNIDINLNVNGNISLELDRDMLKQVILNLILNAVQAIPEKGGNIDIVCTEENDHVKIIIEDNGCGIDEKDLSKIFDPFFTTKSNGTGLGLSIVHRIITELGGSITIESQKGKGTKCTIILPRSENNILEIKEAA